MYLMHFDCFYPLHTPLYNYSYQPPFYKKKKTPFVIFFLFVFVVVLWTMMFNQGIFVAMASYFSMGDWVNP